MAAAGCVCVLAALLSLGFTVAHNHHGETETYRVSAGHLFLLRCQIPGADTNVTWSREGWHNLSLPAGVEVRDGLLWFLPVQTSHNGTYTCEKSFSGGLKMTFMVSVSAEECPDPPENKSISLGFPISLPCKQTEVLRLNNTRNIRWMKDCYPVELDNVNVDGHVWLSTASESDAGKYTCLVEISLAGRKYTAARSIQITIKSDTDSVLPEPDLLYPQQEVVKVEVGMRVELKCKAFIGFSEDNLTTMFWTVDEVYAEDLEEFKESWKYIYEKGRVYRLSTLSISKVLPQFLNVPIICHITNPAGEASGVVLLQEAEHSALYASVALCISTTLAIVALVAASLCFKVDVVLAYRKLLGHFSERAPDGKLYDGYVSFLHPDTQSSAEMESFALQILPKELEKKHGYSLFIRGRDDCPGEAVHDVIAAMVHRCRRLIVILSSESKSSSNGKTEEVSPLCENEKQLCYEQKIGIYDALTQNDPRVILVEIDGPVDYSRLPESLHYIKRKQGALKWKTASNGTHKLTKWHSDRNFWKNLRYHMPSVPTGRLQTIV